MSPFFVTRVAIFQDTERIRIERTAEEISLTIKKVLRTDDGEYSAHIANAAGDARSFANLFVRQPVEFVPHSSFESN